jgi:hypothetical protein
MGKNTAKNSWKNDTEINFLLLLSDKLLYVYILRRLADQKSPRRLAGRVANISLRPMQHYPATLYIFGCAQSDVRAWPRGKTKAHFSRVLYLRGEAEVFQFFSE